MNDGSEDERLTRRTFLKGLAASLVLPSLAGERLASKKPPFDNVIFVCVDDLNDWISCLRGHANARTPNLDRIAAKGILFTDCHAAAPLCNPSRTATYFGKLPTSTGVYLNDQDWRNSSGVAADLSIFESFQFAGLETFGMGKIHHKDFVVYPPWDHYWPSFKEPKPPEGYSLHAIPPSLRHSPKQMRWGSLPKILDGKRPLSDQKVLDEAIRTLSELELRESRFALNIGFSKPHLPWVVHQRYYDLFPLEDIQLPFVLDQDLDDVPIPARRLALRFGDHEKILEQGLWPSAVQAYLATIAFMDEQMGALFDAYEKSRHHERTVFVFWSDNGWHMGEKNLWRKLSLWREATRVPLMIVAPGLVSPGAVCQRPVSLTSLFATLCDLIGTETPEGAEGPSLMPLLKDPTQAWNHPVISALGPQNIALRTEEWCYIRYHDGAEEELYNRARDPREFQNLASVKSTEFKEELAQLMPKRPWPYDPDEGHRRALSIDEIDDDD